MYDIIFILFLSQFIINATNSIIAPFFPQYAFQWGLSQFSISLIFSIHPVGNLICYFLLGKQICDEKYQKISQMAGIFLNIIGIFSFAILSLFQDKAYIFSISLLAKFILGIVKNIYIFKKINIFNKKKLQAQTLFNFPFYSYIPILYQTEYKQKFLHLELFSGMGFLFGPFLSGFLIQAFGWVIPFIIFGIICILLLFTFQKQIPDRMILKIKQNEKIKNQNEINSQYLFYDKIQDNYQIYKLKYSNKNLITVYILMIIPCCGIMSLEATFSLYIQQKYQTNYFFMGIIFSFGMILYIVFVPLIKIIYNYSYLVIFIGIFVTGICFCLIGPYYFLFQNIQLNYICASYIFLSFSILMIYFPSLLLITNIINITNINNKQFFILFQKSYNYYNTLYCSGQFIGPLLGGFMTEFLSFETCNSIFGITVLFWGIIFYFQKNQYQFDCQYYCVYIQGVKDLIITPNIQNQQKNYKKKLVLICYLQKKILTINENQK
ncbi:major facilitator superfamily protein, putative [Ichthyophthirius multifiliis]|uniref:Major facilitator superfamily protein, putative n=1 Tax=Ichthyophthirius multifiliis TaxID=5932 RepID=G0QW06_ICHMU|nr:major facilitator superfamily protein, putative [Ichthyophthirius multifiliis]EGR30599.1 major facilitator superfamily protein, putative [Ichthyophthirius multifiliis]|eukprot:XP_004032186.1 major facilitator superfamily protein, putative [Ichthyophthirius multifiliis]